MNFMDPPTNKAAGSYYFKEKRGKDNCTLMHRQL